MKNKPYLSVIVPLYNEEKRLHKLSIISHYFKNQKINSEIIVVDDGSTDNTLPLLKKLSRRYNLKIISYKINRGKGFAVKTGMLEANGLYRLFIDIDLSCPIEEFKKIIAYIGKYPVVIGSRRILGARILIHQSKTREIMGRIFTKISQVILGLNISDFTCGFKCFSKEAAERIFPKATINRWGFDPEILLIANCLRYSVREIPITWENNSHTKTKIPQDIFISLIELLKIKLNQTRGLYGKIHC